MPAPTITNRPQRPAAGAVVVPLPVPTASPGRTP